MINSLSQVVVILVGLYFIVLAGLAVFNTSQANRFLLGFAGSKRKHFVELFARFLACGALITNASQMFLSELFSGFGWILIVTTVALLFIPWKWHRRFANYSVPKALQYIRLIGVVSLVLGVFVLFAVIRGSAV